MLNARSIGAALALLGCFAAGWVVNGWRLGEEMAQWERDLEASRLQASEKAREVELLSADIATVNGKLFEVRKEVAKAKARVITREVTKYVNSPYAGQCALPVGWVRLDTASATGVSSNDTAITGADDAPSGFTDADALAVIADRNHICRAEIAKLTALQEYVRQQLNIFNQEK